MRKEIEKILKEYKAYETGGLTHATNELLDLFGVSKRFEIDFDGHLKADIQIEDNTPHVRRAVNGYGEAVNCDKVECKQV